MDLHEAYRVLGISETDTPSTRKRKYRRLMMLYHPDSSGDKNIHISQKINAAYEYLKSHEKELSAYDVVSNWEAEINENAFCERAVYVDYSFLDKRIPIRQVAEGRYLWDPYLEEFSMLARSVAIKTADLIYEYEYDGDEAPLFHLLMQDFIEPLSCARKLGEADETEDRTAYLFTGAVGITDTGLLSEIRRMDNGFELFAEPRGPRVTICNEDGVILGDISYDEDSLYYVVNPLLTMKDDGITVNLQSGELHARRRDLRYAGKLDIAIRIEIKKTLAGKVSSHYEEIHSLLNS